MLLSYRDFRPLHQASSRCSRLATAVFLGLTFLYGNIASAAWEFEPRFSGGARYESNPRHVRSSSDEESATGLELNARLPMTIFSQQSSLSVDPRLQIVRYSKEKNEDLDLDNKLVTAVASHSMRRSNVGVSGRYSSLNTRTSEFETQDPDSPNDGTGVNIIDDTRILWNVSPNWSYQISPKNMFALNAGYSEVRFEDKASPRRFDYDYTTLSAPIRHTLNQKSSLAFQANLSEFNSGNPTGIKNDSETNGLSLDYELAISETIDTTVNLGWARTKSTAKFPNSLIQIPGVGDFCSVDFSPPPCEPIISKSDATNFVGGVSIEKSGERTRYRASLKQSITPNNVGIEVVTRRLNGNINQNISSRLSGNFGILAVEEKTVGDDTTAKRDYVSLTASLNWKFTEQWGISGRYIFYYNRVKGFFFLSDSWESSQNHRIFLGVTYTPKGWRN